MMAEHLSAESLPARSPSSGNRRGLIFFVGILLVIGLLELFRLADWDHGVLRTAMLAALGVLLYSLRRIGEPLALSDHLVRWTRPLFFTLAMLAASLCILTAIDSINRTAAGEEILLDQGQNSYRALRLLDGRINSYGRLTLLDPLEYKAVRNRIMRNSTCLVSPIGDYRAEFERYWRTLDVKRALQKLSLVIKKEPGCEAWSMAVESLGYKYGPVLLASYWPFVKLWDKAGIYICSDPYDYLPIRSYPVLFARLMISHLLDQIDQGAL